MRNDPILMHYGVKGMRWRKKKSGIGLQERTDDYTPPRKNKMKVTNQFLERQKQINKARAQKGIESTTEAFNKGTDPKKIASQRTVDAGLKNVKPKLTVKQKMDLKRKRNKNSFGPLKNRKKPFNTKEGKL